MYPAPPVLYNGMVLRTKLQLVWPTNSLQVRRRRQCSPVCPAPHLALELLTVLQDQNPIELLQMLKGPVLADACVIRGLYCIGVADCKS